MGGIFSTPSTAPIATFDAPNRSNPGLFMAPSPTISADVVANGQYPEDHSVAHQHDRKDDSVQCLTQLCQLNVALYQTICQSGLRKFIPY